MEYQGLDENGELTPHLQEHFVGRVHELSFMIGMTGHALERDISHAYAAPADRLLWRQVFAEAEQIILDAGRISGLIRPIRAGKAEVRDLRRARAAFMRSVFDGSEMEPIHNRTVRNRIEHYDERIEEAAVNAAPGAGWAHDIIGPVDFIRFVDSPDPVWTRRFDPPSGEYVAVGETVNVLELMRATNAIYETAKSWLKAHRQ